MKIFSLSGLYEHFNFELYSIEDTQIDELVKQPNSKCKLTFWVRCPDLAVYKFDQNDVLELSNDGLLCVKDNTEDYEVTGKRLDVDYLCIDDNLIERILRGHVRPTQLWFSGAAVKNVCEAGHPETDKVELDRCTSEAESFDVTPVESDCCIFLFDPNKTTNRFNDYEVIYLTVAFSNLLVSAEEVSSNEKLKPIDNQILMRHVLGIFEEIPNTVRKRLESFPAMNDEDFNRLRYLRAVYEEFWSDYPFKDYLRLRVLEEDDIKADRFLKRNYSSVDKKIRKEIRRRSELVETELMRLFVNECLSDSDKLSKNVKAADVSHVADELHVHLDGKSLGKRCAKGATKLVTPSFEERPGGRFKRSHHKIYPVKLWVLHQVAHFFWGNVDVEAHKSHPSNSVVSSFLKSINTEKLSKHNSALMNEFLRQCPELICFPHLHFNKEQADSGAKLIRPQWAYAKNK